MEGDYTGQYEIDVQRYNIRRIADDFIDLQTIASGHK